MRTKTIKILQSERFLTHQSSDRDNGNSTDSTQLVLCNGAGVHEGLGNDREHGVHVVRRLDIKDKLGILHNVDPETERQAADTGDNTNVGRI